jgi:hypothetical protein
MLKKILFLIPLSTIIYIGWFFYNEENRMVRSILNIDSLPNSIEKIECESWGYTDVLTTCRFKIDPKEFPFLLKGWNFSKEARINTFSHNVGVPKTGTNFLIHEAYIVRPKSFKYGGQIQLLTNQDKTDVMVDIYIE